MSSVVRGEFIAAPGYLNHVGPRLGVPEKALGNLTQRRGLATSERFIRSTATAIRGPAFRGPAFRAKIIECLGERVADPESAEVPRQAHCLYTPREGIRHLIRMGTIGVVQDLIPDVNGSHKAPPFPSMMPDSAAVIEDGRCREAWRRHAGPASLVLGGKPVRRFMTADRTASVRVTAAREPADLDVSKLMHDIQS
jgi:hypothetical protein